MDEERVSPFCKGNIYDAGTVECFGMGLLLETTDFLKGTEHGSSLTIPIMLPIEPTAEAGVHHNLNMNDKEKRSIK